MPHINKHIGHQQLSTVKVMMEAVFSVLFTQRLSNKDKQDKSVSCCHELVAKQLLSKGMSTDVKNYAMLRAVTRQ
jgi:hypothetical protein